MSDLLDLTEFKAPKTNNPRGEAKSAKAQIQFELKYRDGNFTLSSAIWNKLGLDTNALAVVIHPISKAVVLEVVENEKGSIAKRTEKTGLKKIKTFKAGTIENALVDTGIITKTIKVKGVDNSYNQFISLTPKQTTDGREVYLLEKANIKDEATSVAESAQAPAQEETAPVADQIPSSDELVVDDFTGGVEGALDDEDFEEKF